MSLVAGVLGGVVVDGTCKIQRYRPITVDRDHDVNVVGHDSHLALKFRTHTIPWFHTDPP